MVLMQPPVKSRALWKLKFRQGDVKHYLAIRTGQDASLIMELPVLPVNNF
ncbi:hypothetical protein SAMN05443252_101101 [Bacillus sp. OV322]|nr:hypothetical protein SAMN05443252_101101 [Bacillus sp. OV322]